MFAIESVVEAGTEVKPGIRDGLGAQHAFAAIGHAYCEIHRAAGAG